MGLDQFCEALAEALDLANAHVAPEARLVEDLGVDSLGALVVQDLIERDGGVTEFGLSEGLGTVRDAYTLYLTISSAPSLAPSDEPGRTAARSAG
jgi:acyl carrier protein